MISRQTYEPMERKLPPGYSIHVGKYGQLQAWYKEQPLIPDMWWESHHIHHVQKECYKDYAERTVTRLEETKQKYRELYQVSGWSDYLRQALDHLDESVYCLQEYVCTLLSNIEDCLYNAQENTGWDREVQKQMAAMNKRKLAEVINMLQDLQVDIPRNQKWPE